MEKRINLWFPGGNYWCHERKEPVIFLQLSTVSGRFTSTLVYPSSWNLKVLYDWWQLTQVGMWTACVTSISWDHHRKLRTQQCHNHSEKSLSPTIELWELQIPSDPHAQSCPTLWFHVLEPARPFCPWNFPGKNTGWVAIPYSRGSTWPSDWTRISSHLDWQPDSLPPAPLKPTQLF